jgi:DNA polymerase III subunit gamma/tau
MAKAKEAVRPQPKPVPPPTSAGVAPESAQASGYTVVARRYRPKQFADLIGQEHVAQALTNALQSGRIAHAYLFTGARGVGKTSAARILAKALNCEKGPTPTPCDRCDICLGIAAGDDVDVIEIDGASNNKVEEIRDLKQNVGFRPTRARFKVYIIDEVHMLSNSAFNALLKTLEEPPPHVKFIFATTEVQKILVTILSRCQRFDFATVNATKIFETLKHIVGKEGLEAEDDALRIVARRANGSMRDSQTLLDQLLGSCEGKLTAARVHELIGTAAEDRVAELAEAILRGDARRGIELVTEASERGLQLGEVLDQLVEFWRGLMLVAVGGPTTELGDVSPLVREKIVAGVAGASVDAVLAGLDVLTAAKAKMRGSSHTQVLLELAVVRLARLKEMLSVAEIAQWVSASPGTGAAPPPRPAAPVSPKPSPSAPEAAKKKPLTEPEVKANPQPAVLELSYETLPKVWEKVIQEVKGFLAAQLRQVPGLPAISGPNALAIRVPSGYNAVYEAIRMERNLEVLRVTLRKVTGKDVAVSVELLAAVALTATPAAAAPPPSASQGRRQELLQLPFLKSAVSVLGAQLMKAEDGFDPTAAPPAVPAVTPAAANTDDDADDTPDSPPPPDPD